ncbi:brassinosteroid-related acyltransferase 1 [Silene latifolia]|uniref:brassinosteroid-related acyltransferase 1 n=1 Tax=Silene latifolia TaxID=37657 RepID=UPI003D77EAF5
MASVYETKRVNVYPKTMQQQQQQQPKMMKLSNLDRQCPTLMYLVFFYKPTNYDYMYGTNTSVFSRLKEGLEETLSLWYPSAGRLSRNPNDGKLNLWCNNGGAIMVEAYTQTRMCDLGNLCHYNEFYEKLVYKPISNGDISEMPLIVAQVTKFGCGGYSIGVGTSHALFDGQATFNFLSAWASKSNFNQLNYSLDWHKPVHGRERLQLNSHPTTAKNQATALPSCSAIQHLYQLIIQASPPSGMLNNPQLMVSSTNQDCILKTFHFTSSMIDILKRGNYGLNNMVSACSSFEIVTAHLWKARTKALGLRKDRMVCLQFAVDTRTRLAPPLSPGFSGNAYVLASVALLAGELELASLETIVNKIKAAKNSINNQYVSSYLEALEGSGGALPPLRELTIVSDWTRTPFHKVNFGHHGQTTASACPLVPPVPQVAYFMQSSKEDKGIDVRIGLSSQILNAFSHYFLTLN